MRVLTLLESFPCVYNMVLHVCVEYWSCMCFGRTVCHEFRSKMVVKCEVYLRSLIWRQKYLISVERERCHLIVRLTIPTAVVLSMCIGVGGCGRPSLESVRRTTCASFVFTDSAPSSASAAEAAIILSIAHVITIL